MSVKSRPSTGRQASASNSSETMRASIARAAARPVTDVGRPPAWLRGALEAKPNLVLEAHVPVDPQINAILQLLAQSGAPSLAIGTPEQARAAFRFTPVDMRNPSTLAPVGSVDNQQIEGPGGPIPIRVYRPQTTGATPTVVFFHGGGFVIGDLDTQDDHARLICRDVDAVVVSVDYRLAPEHPFPAGLEDCLAATRWVAEHVGELGGDADRIAVSGDSAGGNLAAAVALAVG